MFLSLYQISYRINLTIFDAALINDYSIAVLNVLRKSIFCDRELKKDKVIE